MTCIAILFSILNFSFRQSIERFEYSYNICDPKINPLICNEFISNRNFHEKNIRESKIIKKLILKVSEYIDREDIETIMNNFNKFNSNMLFNENDEKYLE